MIAIFGRRHPEAAHDLNRVLDDLLLLLEVRQNIEPAVGDTHQPWLTRQRVFVEQHVAQQLACAQAGVFIQHGVQQFVGAQVSFQQNLDVALARHSHSSPAASAVSTSSAFASRAESPSWPALARILPASPISTGAAMPSCKARSAAVSATSSSATTMATRQRPTCCA